MSRPDVRYWWCGCEWLDSARATPTGNIRLSGIELSGIEFGGIELGGIELGGIEPGGIELQRG